MHKEMPSLTKRQQEVLEAAVKGGTARELANELCIEEKSAKAMLTILYRAFGVKSRSALIVEYHLRRSEAFHHPVEPIEPEAVVTNFEPDKEWPEPLATDKYE